MSEPAILKPEVERVVAELEEAVLDRFADATFEVRTSIDGRVYFTVYTDEDNDFVIQDILAERTVNAMLTCDAKIHIMPRPASVLASR
jgi:hypothetical protein